MKTLIRNLSFLFLFLLTQCAKEPTILKNVQAPQSVDLLQKYKHHISQFNFLNQFKTKTDLYSLLDHTHNYENTIYKLITHDPTYDPTTAVFFSSQSGYNYPNQFDKIFIDNILKDLLNLDVYSFFDKMEYLKDFVRAEVTNTAEQLYLLSIIEEFKWMKYSVYDYQSAGSNNTLLISNVNNGFASRTNFDECFDDCMRSKFETLEEANWIEWTYFLVTAAETVTVWTASCIWDCS